MIDKEEELKRRQAVLKTLDIKIKDSPYTPNKQAIERKKENFKKEINKLLK